MGHIVISYASADRAFVAAFAERLEDDADVPVWWDHALEAGPCEPQIR